MKASDEPSLIPKLLVSSEGVDWGKEIAVQAYQEPAEVEWIDPGTRDNSLILVVRGALRLEQRPINGPWNEQDLYKGDLLLRPGGTSALELHWKCLSPEPLHLLYIYLSPELLARTTEELTKHEATRFTLIERSGFQDPLLTQIGLALWQELEQPALTGKLYGQAAAQMLAVHLLRHYTSSAIDVQERSQGLTPRQLKRLSDFIHEHLSEDLSLEILAQQIGFSPYHFARLFREATGKSPHQFVQQQRIELAKRLLRDTDAPLTHIALESGFADQSHLIRVFKRSLNLTPRVYRRDRSI